MKNRFRGFLPVVVDIETGGVDHKTNPLLEVCMVFLDIDEHGVFKEKHYLHEHIEPFNDAVLCQESLDFNGIDPFNPLRFAITEKEALNNFFTSVRKELNLFNCSKAVLVGHNAWFDLLFLKEATARCNIKSPFHSFTCFDTATLGGVFYKQTVLAKALKKSGISFNPHEAHSAIYDARKTAQLFCNILNNFVIK